MVERGTERGQRGSALVLVPAAVLVLVILGAIAVDLSVVFLGQRELANAAAAAANDAATAAISKEAFYRGRGDRAPGRIEVDEEGARQVARRVLSAQAPRGVTVTGVDVRAPGSQVCVTLEGRVDHLFAKAIPGVPRSTAVRTRASASAVQGPPGSAVSSRSVC